MTDKIDIEALKERALKATQGEWSPHKTYYSRPESNESWMIAADGRRLHSMGGDFGTMRDPEPYNGYGFSESDAAFIAAANPQTVLSLIAALAQLQAENAELRKDAGRWRFWKDWWVSGDDESECYHLPPNVILLLDNLDLDQAMDTAAAMAPKG